jgi:hypothetical protein
MATAQARTAWPAIVSPARVPARGAREPAPAPAGWVASPISAPGSRGAPGESKGGEEAGAEDEAG